MTGASCGIISSPEHGHGQRLYVKMKQQYHCHDIFFIIICNYLQVLKNSVVLSKNNDDKTELFLLIFKVTGDNVCSLAMCDFSGDGNLEVT